ncbi:MAG: hypothetical protein PW792_16435 [Acidobacteriaceae bacterium]|nr:hypothetical protein [Acidobacteriaceae bacterium]
MRLTSKPRAGSGVREGARAVTTEPGFRNPNAQVVVARTGAASTLRANQVIYRMKCQGCSREYGCNGMDIKARLCPFCQGGAAAEPLRDDSAQPTLFG